MHIHKGEGWGSKQAGDRGRREFYRIIAETGCTAKGHKVWSPDEVAVVRAKYPDYAAICVALPHRTRKAIELKAAGLDIVRHPLVWTAAELTRLRRPYTTGMTPSELRDLFPDKEMKQIYARASRSRLRRPRKPPKPTGFPVVDAIRQRAFEHHLTMADLDKIVGATSYFRSPRHVSWRYVRRALRFLEGELRVVWSDSSCPNVTAPVRPRAPQRLA